MDLSVGLARAPLWRYEQVPQSVTVVAEVSSSAALKDGQKAPAPLPVIERQTANGVEKVIVVDPEYVRQQVASIVKDQDLSRYIL